MWKQRNVLNSLLWEAAHDDMGIYPAGSYQKYGTPEQTFTPRTEWENGWNAAVMEMTEKHGKLSGWAESLTPEQQRQLVQLLDSDDEPVHLSVRDDAVRLVLSCGDTFAYACADAERFTLDELPEVARLWEAHGYYGVVAWIARKRKQEPVKEYRYAPRYVKAKADLSPEAPQAPAAVDPSEGARE